MIVNVTKRFESIEYSVKSTNDNSYYTNQILVKNAIVNIRKHISFFPTPNAPRGYTIVSTLQNKKRETQSLCARH